MTYRPRETIFGPPFRSRLPSLFYMGLALSVGVIVLVGERSVSGSFLFDYVVAKDVNRVMSIRTFSLVLLASALAAVIRTSMRGVRIYADGVESREVLSFILPRLKRYRWPQIERIVLDQPSTIALDLWDGTRTFLPRVSDQDKLAETLELIAAARAIPVKGGTLDVDADAGEVEDE